MKLFIIQDGGFDGYGGGYSFLVCAENFVHAWKIVKNIDKSHIFNIYKFYNITENAELGELNLGDWRILSYYE